MNGNIPQVRPVQTVVPPPHQPPVRRVPPPPARHAGTPRAGASNTQRPRRIYDSPVAPTRSAGSEQYTVTLLTFRFSIHGQIYKYKIFPFV